jgi:hypothetical protein
MIRRWLVPVIVPAIIIASLLGEAWARPPSSFASTRGLTNPPGNRQEPALAAGTGSCNAAGNRCQSPCHPTAAFVYNASHACTDVLLSAINQAQAAEGLPGFVLPSNYFSLSATRQMFVLINLERISRGVPPLVGLSPYLSSTATTAASHSDDPPFQTSYGPVQVWAPPSGNGNYAFGGAWGGGSVNAADVVFGWFYGDGFGNGWPTFPGCEGPKGTMCWWHREELLGVKGFSGGTACTDCVAGAGYASVPGDSPESYTFLIVRPVQFPTPLVFTWDGDVLGSLPAGWEKVTAP